jgi:hypothetical protein
MNEEKQPRFPKTNREYFRLVFINGLIFSAAAMLVFYVGVKILAPYHRWRGDDFAKLVALSLFIGLNLTLMRLRWLKGRDK